MPTALDVIESAMKEIGVIAAGETAPIGEANDGLTCLNRLLDDLATQKLTTYTVTRTVSTMAANVASITIGPTGTIIVPRPVFFQKINFIDTATNPDTEMPLGGPLTEDQYAGITRKALTSPYPQAVYYNPTIPNGTLRPWPVPTSATLQWAIYHLEPLHSAAVALTTAVVLPQGYERMLVKNLALDLCPQYSRQPSPLLVRDAASTLANVKRANKRPSELLFGADLPGVGGGGWSIYTGP